MLLSLFCYGGNVCGCDFTIPPSLSSCKENVTQAFQEVSSCKKVEKAVFSFARSANESSLTLCKDLLDVISVGIPDNNSLRFAATVMEYCGTGAWVYLACRSLLKHCYAPLKRERVLQSGFQKFLSSEILAFAMTFPSIISFASLRFDSPGWALAISIGAAGIPALFGGVQLGFDIFKMIRFLFRCCGLCLPSKEKEEGEKRLLRKYHKRKKSEHTRWLDDNPLEHPEEEEENLEEQVDLQNLEGAL